jgi:hypothetical protein
MKKVVLLLFAVLIGAATSSAQVVESKMGGVYVERGPKPEHRWFVKLGGGLAIQDFGYTHDDDLSKTKGTALDLSLGFNRDFKYGSSWYWGLKLGATYTMLTPKIDGGEYRYENEYESYVQKWNSASYDINQINLHVGPTFGFRKGIGSNVKLDVNFTPEFVWRNELDDDDYYFSYSKTYKQGDSHYNYPAGYVKEGEGWRDLYFGELCPIAASATLGVDLWIKKFIIGVNYRYIFDCDELEAGAQTVMLNVGFAF